MKSDKRPTHLEARVPSFGICQFDLIGAKSGYSKKKDAQEYADEEDIAN